MLADPAQASPLGQRFFEDGAGIDIAFGAAPGELLGQTVLQLPESGLNEVVIVQVPGVIGEITGVRLLQEIEGPGRSEIICHQADDAFHAGQDPRGIQPLGPAALHIIHFPVVSVGQPLLKPPAGGSQLGRGDAQAVEPQLQGPAADFLQFFPCILAFSHK